MDHWLKMGSLKRTREEGTDGDNSCATVPVDGVEPADKLHVAESNNLEENKPFLSSVTASVLKASTSKKRKVIRKYADAYLKFGFSWTGDEAEPIPLCVICYEILSNDSMKPSHFKRHFESKHKEYHDKPVEFFENRRKDI